MNLNFNERYKNYTDIINKALDEYVPERECLQKNIIKAMRYSLTAGGKRLRPVLCLATAEILGGSVEEALPFACAVEMIHTYSLIHDDLPCMDNDDYRRGRLTNHKVFGENMAVLAGDALLNRAFEIMLDACIKDEGMETGTGKKLYNRIKAMGLIADAAGINGMIGGQVIDLESEGKTISPEHLAYMHKYKTGELIKCSIMSAAVLNNADENDYNCMKSYAENLGLAFQIKDDILDIEGNFAVMGKTAGSDAANQKSTFVTLYGLEKSKAMLREITDQAVNSILKLGDRADFLRQLAENLANRNN